MVYTDHEALKTLLVGIDNDAHGRIANWQDRLGEYNVQLFHKSSKIHFMGIADGLSRLPTHLLGQHVMEDSDRSDPVLSVASATILAAPCTTEAATRRRNGPLQGKFDGVWKGRNSTAPGQDEDPMTGIVTDWWELPSNGRQNEGCEVGRQRESSMAVGSVEGYDEGGYVHNEYQYDKNYGGSGVSGGGGVEGYGEGGYDQNKHHYDKNYGGSRGSGGGGVGGYGEGGYDQNKHHYGKNYGGSGVSGGGGVEGYGEGGYYHNKHHYGKKYGGSGVSGGGGVGGYGEGGSQSNKHNCGSKHGGPGALVAEGGSGEVGGRALKADGEWESVLYDEKGCGGSERYEEGGN
jgi:hypothetical protein